MVVGPYAKTLGGITVTQLTANDFVLLHWKIEDQTSPYHSLSFAEIEKQSGHPKQNDAIADGSLTKGQPLQLFSDKIKGNKKKKKAKFELFEAKSLRTFFGTILFSINPSYT